MAFYGSGLLNSFPSHFGSQFLFKILLSKIHYIFSAVSTRIVIWQAPPAPLLRFLYCRVCIFVGEWVYALSAWNPFTNGRGKKGSCYLKRPPAIQFLNQGQKELKLNALYCSICQCISLKMLSKALLGLHKFFLRISSHLPQKIKVWTVSSTSPSKNIRSRNRAFPILRK